MDFQEEESRRSFPITKFNVDTKLVERSTAPFANRHSLSVFSGAPGSGKSTLAIGALLSKSFLAGAFDRVYVFIPLESMQSMRDNPFSDLPEDRIRHEVDADTLESLQRELRENSAKGMNSLVLIDDFASDLKRKEVARVLKTIVLNRRHLRTSVWLITQGLILLPLDLRKVITTLHLFKPSSQKESTLVFNEFNLPFSKDEWRKLQTFVFRDKHDFLTIRVDEPIQESLYRNFNKIIFNIE